MAQINIIGGCAIPQMESPATAGADPARPLETEIETAGTPLGLINWGPAVFVAQISFYDSLKLRRSQLYAYPLRLAAKPHTSLPFGMRAMKGCGPSPGGRSLSGHRT